MGPARLAAIQNRFATYLRHLTSPPIIDADAVLSLAVADQRFETIARQDGQIPKRRCRLQPVELQTR